MPIIITIKTTRMKDIKFYRKNAEEDYIGTPISVLRYITELEKLLEMEASDICQNISTRYSDEFTPPFRVGRKQGRAILDANGHQVTFATTEKQAQLYCAYLNGC